jgi:hypothetical protein
MFGVCGGIRMIQPKTNSPNPEPLGSGKNYQPTRLPTRLLCLFFYSNSISVIFAETEPAFHSDGTSST